MPFGRYPVAYKGNVSQRGPGLSSGISERLARMGVPESTNFLDRTSDPRTRYYSFNYSWLPEPIEGWGSPEEIKEILKAMQKDYPTFTENTKYEPNAYWAKGNIFDDFSYLDPGGYARDFDDFFKPAILQDRAINEMLLEWYIKTHSKYGGSFGGGGATGSWPSEFGEKFPKKGRPWIAIGNSACIDGVMRAWRMQIQPAGVDRGTLGPHSNGRFTDFYGFDQRLRVNTGVWSYSGWQAEWNFAATGESATQDFGSNQLPTCTQGTGQCTLPSPLGSTTVVMTERYYDPDTEFFDGDSYSYEVTTGTVWEKFNKSCSELRMIPRPPRKPKPKTWREAVAPRGSQPSKEEQDPDEKEKEAPFQDDWRTLTPDVQVSFRVPSRTGPKPGVKPPLPPVPPVPPVIRKPPNSGRKQRPRKRVKEAPKASLRSDLGPIWVAVNWLTETEDLIKDLHAALPKECQEPRWQADGSRTQARHMLDNIYRCADRLDTAQALENFLNSQIEDMYFGLLLGKPGKFINQRLGLYTGGTRAWSGLVGDKLPPPPKVDIEPDGSISLIFIPG